MDAVDHEAMKQRDVKEEMVMRRLRLEHIDPTYRIPMCQDDVRRGADYNIERASQLCSTDANIEATAAYRDDELPLLEERS